MFRVATQCHMTLPSKVRRWRTRWAYHPAYATCTCTYPHIRSACGSRLPVRVDHSPLTASAPILSMTGALSGGSDALTANSRSRPGRACRCRAVRRLKRASQCGHEALPIAPTTPQQCKGAKGNRCTEIESRYNRTGPTSCARAHWLA
jgi:hypothetical protein